MKHGHHARGGGILDPRLRVEDQPDGAGPGELQDQDVEHLPTLYGITDEAERESLPPLAREANVAGWWHSYTDVPAQLVPTYVGLRAPPADPRLRGEPVHGLLQTEVSTPARWSCAA